MRPDQNEKIIKALFEKALKKQTAKEDDSELPAPVEAQIKKSRVSAEKPKKLIEKSCEQADPASGSRPESDKADSRHLAAAEYQAKQFETIVRDFDRVARKYKRMITAKKNIEAMEEALDGLRDMAKDAATLVRKTRQTIEKART